MIDRLLRTAEAAEILRKSPGTLNKWRCIGGGPKFIKVNGTVRYSESDIQAYIDENRTASTSEYGAEHAENN